MRICTLLVTAFLCFQTTQTVAEKDKMRGCRSGRCKFKLNNRLRILRDLSKSFFPDKNLVGITLKSLHNRQEGTFGELNSEESKGYDIPKLDSDDDSQSETDEDVCPKSSDNSEMLACPTPDRWSRIHCIDYYSLCDRIIQCPNGEDEDPAMCLFHQATSKYIAKMMSTMSSMYRKIQDFKPNYLDFDYEKK